jgi:hypothetical protein
MQSLLRTIEFLGLSLWLGSDVFLSFVVAPGAFRILASRDQAGAMVGFGLWWSQHAVSPKMAALRTQMGSIQTTAADSPLLAEFSRLHRISVSLESGVLLAGFTAMYLTVRELGVGR